MKYLAASDVARVNSDLVGTDESQDGHPFSQHSLATTAMCLYQHCRNVRREGVQIYASVCIDIESNKALYFYLQRFFMILRQVNSLKAAGLFLPPEVSAQLTFAEDKSTLVVHLPCMLYELLIPAFASLLDQN